MQALEVLLRLRQSSCHPSLVPGQSADSSSKVDLLLEFLDEVLAEGHKALVFSQWTSFLDLRISKYSQLSKEFPEEPKYHERLARLYWSQKKHRAAFTHLSAARKLDPENAKYDFIEGRIHVGIGNYTGAEKAYKAMIAKTPEGFAGPTYELGFLYLGIGREAEAKTMY